MPIEDKEETFGIDPARIYRKYDKRTQEILGLGRTAIDAAIKDGHIPPPIPLTNRGTAIGWMGTTLIALQKKRLSRAAEWQASPKRRKMKGRRTF